MVDDALSKKKISEKLGITWEGDFLDSLSEYEQNAGFIKFNIPSPDTPESLNGEGFWGWVSPEDKEKYDDDSFYGKLAVILCNDPIHYYGQLLAGQKVIVRCNGASRPILDPEWAQKHLRGEEAEEEEGSANTVDYEDEITKEAERLLKDCVDDYATRIWEEIAKDVIDGVIEYSGIADGEDFSDGDVCLAIGRAICQRLGIET